MSTLRAAALASLVIATAAVWTSDVSAQVGVGQPGDIAQVGHKPKPKHIPKKFRGVPELNSEAAGAALVLAIGGVLVLTGGQRRRMEIAGR